MAITLSELFRIKVEGVLLENTAFTSVEEVGSFLEQMEKELPEGTETKVEVLKGDEVIFTKVLNEKQVEKLEDDKDEGIVAIFKKLEETINELDAILKEGE